jgi:hypothetical protein
MEELVATHKGVGTACEQLPSIIKSHPFNL